MKKKWKKERVDGQKQPENKNSKKEKEDNVLSKNQADRKKQKKGKIKTKKRKKDAGGRAKKPEKGNGYYNTCIHVLRLCLVHLNCHSTVPS